MQARVKNERDWKFLNRDNRYGSRVWFDVISRNGNYVELDVLGWFYYKQVELQ